MAQLRDTVISGSLRATDSLLTTTLQTQILEVPTASNGTTYGPGSNGQVLISNGTSTYWGTTTSITQVGTITTGTWNATEIAVNKGGTGKTSWTPWGIIYASANTTLAQVTAGAAGNNGYLLESKGAAAPNWIQATDSNVGSTIIKRDSNGDFTSRLISGVRFLASRTDHSASTGMIAENTDSTDPLKLGYIIGTGGEGGIYDYTHSAWKVEIAPDGTTNFYGNATSSTSAKWLMNRGGDTVTIDDSSWDIQKTPSGHTNRATVFKQKWTQSGLTYTPSGGSATTNTNSADLALWLSSSDTDNVLQLNMQLDGLIYAMGGFVGDVTGDITGGLKPYAFIGNSTTDHGVALKNWFTANKSTAPRNKIISFYSSTSSNSSQYMGYFLAGYDDNPYGGFFVCHYGNPYYVGIANGTYTQQHILTSTNYTSYTVTKTGSGASGSWGISITGDCSGSASKITNISTTDAASSSTTWRRIWIAYSDNVTGRPAYTDTFAFQTSTGTMKTGRISTFPAVGTNLYNEGIRCHASSGGWTTIMLCGPDNTGDTNTSTKSWGLFNHDGTFYINKNASDASNNSRVYANANGWYFNKAYGAVWNDFAEYRRSDINEPGRVVIPHKDGIAYIATERLQAGGRIISDTFGFAVGASDKAKTPIGLSGRVLAYPYQKKENFKVGDAVCSAPNGTVDIMTREEIKEYPDRIIGIVNEIPDYDIWSESLACSDGGEPTTTTVNVNGRIWIDIK